MELRNYTQKAKSNALVWMIFAISMSYVLYCMIESSVSCIDNDACVKKWCQKAWFTSQLQSQIEGNSKC